jgi:hypothetical protein
MTDHIASQITETTSSLLERTTPLTEPSSDQPTIVGPALSITSTDSTAQQSSLSRSFSDNYAYPTETLWRPTIGVDVEEGKIGLHGVDWLKARLQPRDMEPCAIILAEMLKQSISWKRDATLATQDWLAGLVGDDARRRVLRSLQQIGAISPADRANRRCDEPRQFTLTNEYRQQPLATLPLSNNAKQRIQRSRHYSLEQSLETSAVCRALWEDLHHASLHPSWIQAMPLFSEKDYAKRWSWTHSAKLLQSGRPTLSCRQRDGFDLPGRVYTSFSSTPSVLRKYALIDGEPLVCIDVKACQPFLHATLIEECEERRCYLANVNSGQFYEDLAAEAGIASLSRAKIKERVFQDIYYGPNQLAYHSPVKDAFARRYPRLSTQIALKKSRDFRTLPIEMQHLEAKIVIYTAVAGLKLAHPRIRLLTVHDAVYVPKRHAEITCGYLRASFIRFSGESPELRVEAPPPHLAF